MVRDFSEEQRQRLLEMVKQVQPDSIFEKVIDFFDDFYNRAIIKVNINNFLDDMSNYHRKMIDYENISAQKINKIFRDVADVDTSYKNDIEKTNTTLQRVVDNIKKCSEAFSYSVAKMTSQSSVNTATSSPTPSSNTGTYVVKRGDTLTAIARRYNTTVEELVRLNNIKNPDLIITGQTLIVPNGTVSNNTTSNEYTSPQSSTPVSTGYINDGQKASIDVVYYSQGNPEWSGTYIGTRTIGDVGCLVTSIAMVESYSNGVMIKPNEMVKKLRFDNNSLYWSSAEQLGYTVKDCKQTYHGLTTEEYQTIVEQLRKGHPVVIGAHTGDNQHWVVITGYTGDGNSFSASDFMINDPGNSSRKTLADLFAYRSYPAKILYKDA